MRFHSHHVYCYPRDRWWVAHFWGADLTYHVELPDGTVVVGEVAEREYVDISTPPIVTATGMAFVDLALDVGRRVDGSVVILDEDEMERDRAIPDQVVEGAWTSCAEVFAMMRAGDPPFDEKVPKEWLDVFLAGL
jgi:predicted RNA-binding protein associated with RNAse of E/G family